MVGWYGSDHKGLTTALSERSICSLPFVQRSYHYILLTHGTKQQTIKIHKPLRINCFTPVRMVVLSAELDISLDITLGFQRGEGSMEVSKQNYTPISVVMIVKDEASIIESCLSTVSWADEIVVLDTGSSDNTPKICRDIGVRVYHSEKWEGFGKARQHAVSLASHDWIFSLDADEFVSPQLQEEIKQLRMDGFKFDAYRLIVKSYYLGKRINYCGWQNESHVTLFNRQKGNFNSALVHESVKIQGRVGKLKGVLHHHTYPTKEVHIDKMIRYGNLGAQKLRMLGKKSSPLKALSRATFTFLKMYVLKGGFLDGKNGFNLCKTTAWGTWYKYHQLWRLSDS